MAMAAVLLFAPAANAQKVNEEALRAKLTKSDTEIQDAKKSAKAATWLNRAKVYFESIQKPTESLFVSLDPAMLKIACGEPTKAGDTVWEYPMFKVYFKDSLIKVEVALCRGKHTYDKRQSLKEKDLKREADRHMKEYA